MAFRRGGGDLVPDCSPSLLPETSCNSAWFVTPPPPHFGFEQRAHHYSAILHGINRFDLATIG
jgi:hypothetical protein